MHRDDIDAPREAARAETLAAHAHLFDALSDRSRLRILQHLFAGEHRVRDLVAHLGLAQSTVSGHLRFLQECRLVAVRPEGRSSWYSLADPDELAALIDAASSLLLASGDGEMPRHEHLEPAARTRAR